MKSRIIRFQRDTASPSLVVEMENFNCNDPGLQVIWSGTLTWKILLTLRQSFPNQSSQPQAALLTTASIYHIAVYGQDCETHSHTWQRIHPTVMERETSLSAVSIYGSFTNHFMTKRHCPPTKIFSVNLTIALTFCCTALECHNMCRGLCSGSNSNTYVIRLCIASSRSNGRLVASMIIPSCRSNSVRSELNNLSPPRSLCHSWNFHEITA